MFEVVVKQIRKTLGIYFFGIGIFLFPSFSSAENYAPISQCETEMLKAFTEVEEEFQKKIDEYTAVQGVTMTGKTKNLGSYDRTYDCKINAVCFAVQNPNPQSPFPNSFGKCGGMPSTVAEFSAAVGADFSSCGLSNLHTTSTTAEIYKRCHLFAGTKLSLGRSYMADQTIKQSALENHSLLGLKLVDIQKKMAVLLDKTRTFTTSFIKINDDLNCTISDTSGNQ